MKSIKENFAPFLFAVVILGLFLFPIWSHFDLKQGIDVNSNQIKDLQISGGGELAGGITRTKIGAQTSWQTSLVPSASFSVNLGSSAKPVNDIFTKQATGSVTFEAATGKFTTLSADGSLITISKSATESINFEAIGYASASQFFSSGASSNSFSGSLNTSKGIHATGNLTTAGLLIETGAGSDSFAGSLRVTKGLMAGSYQSGGLTACISAGNVLRYSAGQFSCGTLADADIPDTITLSGGTIGSNNISGTLTTTGTLTIGDGGDRIDFDSSGWDVANSVFSGLTGLTSTGTVDFSGATLFKIISAAAPTINAAGEIAMNTTSSSFDWFDGTNQQVIKKDNTCFTYIVDSPTASNPGFVGLKRFNDPFTITSVQMVASGSNAAGWNLKYGVPGTITTSVFTANKSASTSTSPTYTSFTNSSLTDGQVLEVAITSRSAVLQTFSVSVCGRYTH